MIYCCDNEAIMYSLLPDLSGYFGFIVLAALAGSAILVFVSSVLVCLRLRRLVTTSAINQEFAEFGNQIETLTKTLDGVQSDVSWLIDDRAIRQSISMSRSHDTKAGETVRLPVHRRRRFH